MGRKTYCARRISDAVGSAERIVDNEEIGVSIRVRDLCPWGKTDGDTVSQ